MSLFSLPSRKTSSYVQNISNISLLVLIFTTTVGFRLQIQALHKLCLHFTHVTAAGHNHERVCKSHVIVSLLCPTSCTTPETSPTSFRAAPSAEMHLSLNTITFTHPTEGLCIELHFARQGSSTCTGQHCQGCVANRVLSMRGLALSLHPITIADLVPLHTETQRK